MTKRVAIIGGGITGLAAAHELRKRTKDQSVEITLFESDARAGGKVVTELVSDFIIEGGPDSIVTDKPWAVALCREVGLGDELIPSNQKLKSIYVLQKGRLLPFPGGFRLTIPTEIIPFLRTRLISPLGKLRMGLDLIRPNGQQGKDESLASFITRRFGQEALDALAGPMMAGIFVADPKRMSMEATFPRFLDMERKHGSLVRAAYAAKREMKKKLAGKPPPPLFMSLRGGMQTLTDTLARSVQDTLRLSTPVQGVRAEAGRVVLSFAQQPEEIFDAAILAVPSSTASLLLTGHHADLASSLGRIRTVSTAVIAMAFAKKDLPASLRLDGYGVLIPSQEKRRLIACTWSSIKFHPRAPDDYLLTRLFVGGSRDESTAEQPEEVIIELVLKDLREIFGIQAKPVLHRLFRWPKANPQYDVGQMDLADELEAKAKAAGPLYLAGSSYRGLGLPDCIHSAQRAVEALLNR